MQIIESEWQSEATPLPSRSAFDPFDGSLDAIDAWHNFGGLTRSQAYARFNENPETYQEDFMFMGGAAFAYYYPVIERYLLEAEDSDDPGGRQAWILARCIKLQFDWPTAHLVAHLRPRILALASHVKVHLQRYDADPNEQARLQAAWRELEDRLATVNN